MNRRHAFTLIELLIVIAIVGILIAAIAVAVTRAKLLAQRTRCQEHLHQLGSGIRVYAESNGALPRYRLCPDWNGGTDPYCESLTSPSTYTGPNEVWWAPYDNRPGSSPTTTLDENYQRGILWKFVEQNRKIFQCPEGVDLTAGSPTFGQTFQVSYGMNYVTDGPSGQRIDYISNGNGTSNVALIWDHGRTPGCANSKFAAPRGPWQPFINDADDTHYPVKRHQGVFHVLFCDGHVQSMTQNDLIDRMFYAR